MSSNGNSDIIGLLDILYGMVTDAWGVPLGNDKCIIEREKAIEIINEIKASLPSSVAEAQRLVTARDEFIGNAKREAESLRKSAEEKSRAMVEEQEIVRVAKAKSNEMISYAEAKSNELRRVAAEYVEQIMAETEKSMRAALATMETAHNSFRSAGVSAAAQSTQNKEAVSQEQPEEQKQQAVRPQMQKQQRPQNSPPKEETKQPSQQPKPQMQRPPVQTTAKVQRIQRMEEEEEE